MNQNQIQSKPEGAEQPNHKGLSSSALLESWLSDAPESIKWAYHNQATVNRALKECAMRGMSEKAMLWELAATQSRLNQYLWQNLERAAEKGFKL